MRYLIKRATAFILSVMLTILMMPPATVFAAPSGYYINFVDADNTTSTTIVEGADIQAKGVLPPNHAFSESAPFFILDENGMAQDNLFSVVKHSSTQHYTIAAKPGAADGTTNVDPARLVTKPKTYTLRPNLTADINEGTGVGRLKVKNVTVGRSDTHSTPNIDMPVSSSKPVSVTSSNRITLTFDTSEDDGGTPQFKPLTAGDGSGNIFSNFASKGMTPLVNEYKLVGNTRTFKIRFDGDDNIFSFSFPLNAGDLIQAGSTIELQYNLQEVNTLTLAVITPRIALERIAQVIPSSATDPNVTDGVTPYIGTTDDLLAIRSQFKLLQRIALHNDRVSPSRITIGWSWSPQSSDPTHAKVVQINKNEDRVTTASVVPLVSDVPGYLVASPQYRLADGSVLTLSQINPPVALPKVPINVLGTGSLPKLVPLVKTYYDTVTGGPKPIPLVDFPNTLDVYKKSTDPAKPYEFTAQLEFGQGYGRAQKVVVTSSKQDAIELYFDNSPTPYTYGNDLININDSAGVLPMRFVPKSTGQVTLTFTFYTKNGGTLTAMPNPISKTFTVFDSTPSDFAEFDNIKVISPEIAALAASDPDIYAKYPRGEIDYGFKSENPLYEGIMLPSVVENLQIIPTIPSGKKIKDVIKYNVTSSGGMSLNGTLDLRDDTDGFEINGLTPNTTYDVMLTVTSDGGRDQVYQLKFTRVPPETDSSLGSISITDIADNQLLQNFVPTVYSYDITVPFGTRWAKVKGKRASLWAQGPAYIPSLIDKDITGPGDWLPLTYLGDPKGGIFDGPKTTKLEAAITAKNGTKTTYTFNITRKDPSTNDKASLVTFKDKEGKEITLANDVKFDKETRRYDLRIPYSLKELTVEVTADDTVALEAEVKTPGKTDIQPNNTTGKPMVFRFADADLPLPTVKNFDLTVGVRPESGADPVLYTFKVTRNDPDGDTLLADLKLQDQNKNPITSFSFNPLTPDYTVPVSYKAESVTIIPTTRSPLARVEIDSVVLDKYTTSHTVMLKAGETKTVSVKVFPEDLAANPPYREYKLTLTRALPSTDARLVSLKVTGGESFSPTFDPNRTSYSVTMPEGTASITITAEPKDTAATLLINGEGATAGKPSNAITPIDAYSDIPIVVTAEDGKTKMTYTIRVTNRNLIPKSTNADLRSLTVNYGDMSPKFKPSITEYEVAVKNDTASVDIIPVPAIAGSTVEVFMGSRKLGDYSNNYSAKLEDGENEFSVKIVAEEGKVNKTYNIIVYRKDEEKQGKYNPLTTDMVDYEKAGDIIVDITKYPIISAEVFNTLKTKYPEKNMVFEGNDYTLTLRGKDLDKLIPHEQLFDLSLSFTSPLEDEIWDVILSDYRNSKVDPVFVHFNHHGALPAPMVLTLSLGRQYRNLSATWNYYNEERERIDFYGGVKTNSRGTFSLKLTHMSTYIFSDHQIVGAENKSGDLGGTGGLTSGIDGGKYNPNTGAP